MNLSALHACLTRGIVPAEFEVVHEPDALLIANKSSDLKAAETSHDGRKLDLLKLTALLRRTSRDGDVLLVREDLVVSEASIGVPGKFHSAALWSGVVTT